MGCDIHLAVERRTADGWERAEPMVPPHWKYDGAPELEREGWYGGRNYVLFAVLADVRNNGFGFTPVAPIDEPRGLPEDVCDETRAESDEWGIDGHSHSWFALTELLGFDWDQKVTRTCWARKQRKLLPHVGSDNDDSYAKRLQEAAQTLGGLPYAASWGYETCGMSSEGQGPSGWRTIQWEEPLGDVVGSEWLRLLVRMARIAGDDPSSVRIVFWFDN